MKRIFVDSLKRTVGMGTPTASAHPLAAVNQATPINVVDVLPDGFREAGWREVRDTLIGNMRIIRLEKPDFYYNGVVFCDSERRWLVSAFVNFSLSGGIYSYRIRDGIKENAVADWFESVIQNCRVPVCLTSKNLSEYMMALAMALVFFNIAIDSGINVFGLLSLPCMLFAFLPQLILEPFFSKEAQAIWPVYREIKKSVARKREEQESAATLGMCL